MRDELHLDDVLLDIGVGVAKGAQAQQPADGDWGLLRLSSLSAGVFSAEHAKRLPSWDPVYSKLEVRNNDVLMVRVNGAQSLVGSVCVAKRVRPRLVLSDLMYRLVPDETKIDPDFLGLLLGSRRARQQIRTAMRGTSGQFQLPQSEIKLLKIPDVPMAEQLQIAAVYASFERKVGSQERTLGKLMATQNAALESALHAGRMHGLIPLEALLQGIQSGWSPACDSHPPAADEWGVIRVSAVTSGRFDPSESKRLPPGLQPRPALEIRQGDVLIARANGARSLVGSVCHVGATRRHLMLSDKTLRLVPDPGAADPAFLAIVFSSEGVRGQVGNLLNGGTGQNNISQADIRGLRVPAVPLDDQRQIVATQELFERRVKALRVQIKKLRTAQQAVVEDLLSGKVRIPAL